MDISIANWWGSVKLFILSNNDRSNIVPSLGFKPRTTDTLGGFGSNMLRLMFCLLSIYFFEFDHTMYLLFAVEGLIFFNVLINWLRTVAKRSLFILLSAGGGTRRTVTAKSNVDFKVRISLLSSITFLLHTPDSLIGNGRIGRQNRHTGRRPFTDNGNHVIVDKIPNRKTIL